MWPSSGQTRLAAVMYVRGFSVLTLGAIAIRWPDRGLWFAIATWLLVHAAESLMVGAALPRASDRHVLISRSALNLLAALVVAVASVPFFDRLLYAGAAYTAVYGALQIAAGRLRATSVLGVAAIRP